MTTTREIQKFYERLLELKDAGFDISVEESHKNASIYWISKRNGNAEYKDCVIMYNGCEEDEHPENVCKPSEIPASRLLEDVEGIVSKINKIL